jgi:hypothetical protein
MKKILRWLMWHLYWKYESRKCFNDPHYFYIKYYRRLNRDGSIEKMSITKEQFNEYIDYFKNGSHMLTMKGKTGRQRYNEYRNKKLSK